MKIMKATQRLVFNLNVYTVCMNFVKVFPLLYFFSSQFHVGLNDNFSLAPDGPRLQVSPVSFSPAPRGLISSETRGTPNIPRDGPVEIPNTEELYKALSLRTEILKMSMKITGEYLKGVSLFLNSFTLRLLMFLIRLMAAHLSKVIP